MKIYALAVCLIATLAGNAQPVNELNRFIQQEKDSLFQLYRYLHQHPELSGKEINTSRLLASAIQQPGWEVTTGVGGYGVVGVLKNGTGPTVLVRTDMDALPIEEKTGVPFASTATIKDSAGSVIPVMHACGHDFHMTTWVAVAKFMTLHTKLWKGTLVFIAQPAEETMAGAKAMLADGLYTRFPRPDYALALHVNAKLPAGTVGICSGGALAQINQVDITVKGKGGHGGMPNFSKDPIVLSAQLITALQTIVSREINPAEPAVITVGSIHGGSSSNTIPSEVKMGLTVRSVNDAVQAQMIASIRRMASSLAAAGGWRKEDEPVVEVRNESSPLVYNDPALAARMDKLFRQRFGTDQVISLQPEMYGEDFGFYRQTEPALPSLMYSVGTLGNGPMLSTHSPLYLPALDPALATGIQSMTWALIELLGKEKNK